MDDKKRQATTQNAQEAREQGAALEYDAKDQSALGTPAPAPGGENTPSDKEK